MSLMNYWYEVVSDRKSVVVGAGYIAVELAGILSALGSDVSLLIRYDKVTSCVIAVILCGFFG